MVLPLPSRVTVQISSRGSKWGSAFLRVSGSSTGESNAGLGHNKSMEAFKSSLTIGLGAAVGANARFWFGHWFTGRWTPTIPWHTLIINAFGSLVLGVFMALALAKGWGTGWRLLVAVGFAGGFTTFSAFSAEAMTLLEEAKVGASATYVTLSVSLSIAACFAGLHFARLALGK